MSTVQSPTLSTADILAIAQSDATQRYDNLERYRIEIFRDEDGWHVEYEIQQPKDPKVRVAGGGPHYVIDPVDGRITSKKYYQ